MLENGQAVPGRGPCERNRGKKHDHLDAKPAASKHRCTGTRMLYFLRHKRAPCCAVSRRSVGLDSKSYVARGRHLHALAQHRGHEIWLNGRQYEQAEQIVGSVLAITSSEHDERVCIMLQSASTKTAYKQSDTTTHAQFPCIDV